MRKLINQRYGTVSTGTMHETNNQMEKALSELKAEFPKNNIEVMQFSIMPTMSGDRVYLWIGNFIFNVYQEIKSEPAPLPPRGDYPSPPLHPRPAPETLLDDYKKHLKSTKRKARRK